MGVAKLGEKELLKTVNGDSRKWLIPAISILLIATIAFAIVVTKLYQTSLIGPAYNSSLEESINNVKVGTEKDEAMHPKVIVITNENLDAHLCAGEARTWHFPEY